MTEKRFIPIFDGTDKRVVGAKDNGKIISFMNMFDLLNDLSEENEQLQHRLSQQEMEYATDLYRLSEENEQLKKDCTVLIYHNQEYRKENELLKSTINTLTHDNTKMKKVLNTTKKENEHIKNTIQEAYHNERTKLGQSVLKQLLNNIEAIQ